MGQNWNNQRWDPQTTILLWTPAIFDMPSIDPHSYTILYQVTLMAAFNLARMGTTSSAMRSDQRTSIGRKVIPWLDLHQLLPSNLVIVSCCIMMYHFGASLPLKTSTKCFKYLQRSLVASQKSQHFSQSDGHVLELIKRDWVTWITWNATLHYTPTLPTLAKSAWFLQRRRKKGFLFLPGIPAEVKFLGTCIEPKALKKTLLQLSSSKKGILLGCWGLWVQKQQTYGIYPIGSMYAIYGNIYHQYTPNVSIYTIHGSYGYWNIHDGIIWTCLCSMIRIHLLSICHINLLDWTFRT